VVQLFRKNWFVFTLLLFPYTILTRVWVFFGTPNWPINIENPSVAYKFLDQHLPGTYIWNVMLASFIIFLNAVIINHIVIKNRIAREINLYPGMLFILLTSIHKDMFWVSPHLISVSFLSIGISSVFRVYQKPNASIHLFNTGFFVGLSTMFFSPHFLFLIFAFLSTATLRKIKFRDFIQILVGFVLVFLFGLFFRFWNYGDVQIMPGFSEQFSWVFSINNIKLNELLIFLLLLILTISSFIYYRKFTIKKSIQSQKKVNLIYWILFFGILCLSFNLNKMLFSGLIILILPLSICGSMLMNRFKNDLGLELLHFFILFFIIFSHFWF
jgi:hypothetical protein